MQQIQPMQNRITFAKLSCGLRPRLHALSLLFSNLFMSCVGVILDKATHTKDFSVKLAAIETSQGGVPAHSRSDPTRSGNHAFSNRCSSRFDGSSGL